LPPPSDSDGCRRSPVRGRLALALLASPALGTGAGAQEAPPLASYEAVDLALEEEILLPLGTTWRYLAGHAEPPLEYAWTKAGFDDSAWSEGTTPIGFGHEDNATRLDELEPAFTTIYLRALLDVPDLEEHSGIFLEMPIDDGYIVYVNGREEGRLHAGLLWHTPFDATASSQRTLDETPLPRVDLTGKLKAGVNQIALQGLCHADDAETLSLRPRVRAELRFSAEAEAARLASLRGRISGDGAAALLGYLEGRHLQRTRKCADATSFFVQAAQLDPSAALPWQRLVECHRELGTLPALEESLRARLATSGPVAALFDAWARLFFELGGQPTELPALGLAPATLPTSGFFADALYAGTELGAGRPLLVDAGASEDHGTNGALWSRDRYFLRGRAEESEGDRAPLATVRAATRAPRELGPAYRVPLPDGAYELRLHLADQGDERVDVVVDDARVAREHRAYADDPLRLPVRVTTGQLDLDVLPRGRKLGRIAGFELTPLEPDAFEELARNWAEDTGWRESFPIVQLAEARTLLGEEDVALDLFEQAAALPGFRASDRARLQALRDALLPRLLSFDSAEDLVERRTDECDGILAEVRAQARSRGRQSRAAARSDNVNACALYFEGRIHLAAGRLDEAIGAFEELAFSGENDPEPVFRMAQCLVDSELLPEAEGILRESLESGVPPTPDILRLWIALNLGELGRDVWDVVADLRAFGAPDRLVIAPTAEEAAQAWDYSDTEPPTTTWSRPTYDSSGWAHGPAGIGTGLVTGAVTRSAWDTHVLFARRPFTLPGANLPYAYVRTAVDDAGDVYLNGELCYRLYARTEGYVEVPVRAGGFRDGLNYVGMYAINVRGPGYADVGVFLPLAELEWVLSVLERRGAIRINCGGTTYEAADGTIWSADRFSSHGRSRTAEDRPEIKETEDDALYWSQTWFDTTEAYSGWYKVPLPDGNYDVTLHFAEVGPEELSEDAPRRFDVELQGNLVLEDLDLAASAGPRTAQTYTFEVEVDRWLDVELERKQGHPVLSALEIVRRD
jgi:tetratricopeptide (TPR) repeat protein